MRSGFENWHSNSKDKSTSSAFAAGWMCQQSKVDELQKRVDAAQELFDDWNCGGMNLFDLLDALEQTLKGGSTLSLNTDENGECRHFSTTMFNDGKAECFHCDAIVNGKREVIGKQSKGLHPFFKKAQKN